MSNCQGSKFQWGSETKVRIFFSTKFCFRFFLYVPLFIKLKNFVIASLVCRLSSSEAEAYDGVCYTQNDINLLDFRVPNGIGMGFSNPIEQP